MAMEIADKKENGMFSYKCLAVSEERLTFVV